MVASCATGSSLDWRAAEGDDSSRKIEEVIPRK
jgi:hypothetical protein